MRFPSCQPVQTKGLIMYIMPCHVLYMVSCDRRWQCWTRCHEIHLRTCGYHLFLLWRPSWRAMVREKVHEQDTSWQAEGRVLQALWQSAYIMLQGSGRQWSCMVVLSPRLPNIPSRQGPVFTNTRVLRVLEKFHHFPWFGKAHQIQDFSNESSTHSQSVGGGALCHWIERHWAQP